MAKRKRQGHSLPHSQPQAPDGRQYTDAELLLAAVSLEMPLNEWPLRILPYQVYAKAERIAQEHAKVDKGTLMYQLHCTNWHLITCGVLGQRLGINELGYLQRNPPSQAQLRRLELAQLVQLRHELFND
jgi:hypothetical protein